MGIFNDAELVLGWYIDSKLAEEWLLEREVGSCHGGEDQCQCGKGYCWKEWPEEYQQFTIIVTCPYFDCSDEDRYWSLSVDFDVVGTTLNEINSANIDWEAGRRLASKLGANDCEPQFIALPNIS